MNHLCRRLWQAVLLCVAVGLAPAGAQTVPAQQPLLNRNGGGVKPNVMLTLDVSGSMSAQHMPEGVMTIGAHTVVSPPGARFTRLHPDDGGMVGADGPIPAVPGGRDYYSQQFLRSPDTNALYYNPEIRYLPWIQGDGSRYGNADPTKARLDPNDSTKTVDLTKVENRNVSWCTYLEGPGKECKRENLTYSPGLYYRLKKPGGAYADPLVAANYDEFHLNATGSPTFTKSTARTDCAGTVCTQDEERRNFANWFVYHRSRLLLAKAALGEALQGMPDAFRLGYGRTDRGPGVVDGIKDLRIVESGVRDFNDKRKAAVMAWLYNLKPAGSTPLRLAINEVGRYYSSKLVSGPWSDTPGSDAVSPQQACRRAYHVLMTDGYWNDLISSTGVLRPVGNVDGTAGSVIRDDIAQRNWQYQPAAPYKDDVSDTLADYALYFWSRDLRDDLPNTVPPTKANPATWQSMTNFTVGLGVRGLLDSRSDLPALTRGAKSWGDDKIDDLWHAAVNSRGGYFSAQSAEQLRVALESAMRSAVERELPEAGVATSSATLETGSRTYIPRYRSGVWTGDIEAYALDRSSGKTTGASLWSARDQLPLWTNRSLFTWEAAKGGVAFEWNRLGAATRNAIDAEWRSAALVDFIRGDRSSEETPRNWRVRESVLGDFINSAPVFVKGGSDDVLGKLPVIGASYADYVTSKGTRSGVLYVGGNDGMLHAFRDKLGAAGSVPDGAEMFAYVPAAVIPKLHILAQRSYGSASNFHQYYVDGPLREADVHVKAPGAGEASWRNYLFGSTGAGARSVFALDITEPEAFAATSVRWEINSTSQAELGHVMAPVAHGQLPNGKWVALFGNGLGGESGKPSLFVVDVETGAVTRIQPDTAETDNGLGGVAVRRDSQGQVVALYAGDLAGNLWRFDYDAQSAGWFKVGNGGKALFRQGATDATQRQAIIQAPLVFDQKAGGQLVVFATGRLITLADADNTAAQAVYGVWDRPVGMPQGHAALDVSPPALTLKPTDLASRTLGTVKGTGTRSEQLYFTLSGEKIDWAKQNGWVINLGGLDGYAGLRVLLPLQPVRDRVVLVGAVAPGGAVAGCDASTGKGVNLLVPIDTGAAPSLPYFDTNGDGAFNSTDARAVGYATSTDGADAVVHDKKPVATGDSTGNPPKAEPNPDPTKGEKAKPAACGSGLVYLVGGYATHAACLQSRLPIVGRLWRRVMAPPF